MLVPSLLQALPQQAQLEPCGAVLAGLQVVPSVCETVNREAKLRAVKREGLEQEEGLLRGSNGVNLTKRLRQKFVEDIAKNGADGVRNREIGFVRHGEGPLGVRFYETSVIGVRKLLAIGRGLEATIIGWPHSKQWPCHKNEVFRKLCAGTALCLKACRRACSWIGTVYIVCV